MSISALVVVLVRHSQSHFGGLRQLLHLFGAGGGCPKGKSQQGQEEGTGEAAFIPGNLVQITFRRRRFLDRVAQYFSQAFGASGFLFTSSVDLKNAVDLCGLFFQKRVLTSLVYGPMIDNITR